MIKWAGWLMVFYGTAHTVAALTVEGAAKHAGSFSGDLWNADLSHMSPANSAYWLSLSSFGPPLILIGMLVVWMDRRGVTPPSFVAWSLGALTVVDVVVNPFTPWPIILLANLLLLRGIRSAEQRTIPTLRSST
jgi:hypothetical protein